MMTFRNRHFLKLLDFSPTEIDQLIQAGLTLKKLRLAGQEKAVLEGLNIALLFNQLCPEVRWPTEAAIAGQGGRALHMGPEDCGLNDDDSLLCSGRLIGRVFDAVAVHGVTQEKLEELARLSGVSLFNLGSSAFQPLAVLSDLATVIEVSSKPFYELSLTFLGDGRSQVARSLMVGASKLGLDFRFCGPKDMQPEENLTETCLALASESGAQIRLFTEPEESVKGTDFIYTHSWNVEDKKSWDKRVKKLLPYRLTNSLVGESGNHRCHLLHRLPVVLGDETDRGAKAMKSHDVDGLEVSRELFDSASNLAFDQAENQLHCTKAVLVSLLA